MKKISLLSIFLLTILSSHAQNYQCLQSGVIPCYTNGDGYLRGMRTDSVRTSGSDVVYYPYHTERKSNYIPGTGPSTDDIAGSSWLGKKVTAQPDGTFIFNNYWDTVVIKSQAHLGDSWIFFNDTTPIDYIASISVVDTMSILGSVDSIKKISISSDSAGFAHPIDPLNNFSIILSKNHGFVQVFDLYTFPYHQANRASYNMYASHYYFRGYDFYLDALLGNLGTCDVCPGDRYVDTNNSVFHLINFANPTMMQLYDFAAGDVYESNDIFSTLSPSGNYTKLIIDSIISKTAAAYSDTYEIHEYVKTITPVFSGSGSFIRDTFSYSYTALAPAYDTSLFLHLNRAMPEEYNGAGIVHYHPNTTAGTLPCYYAAIYTIDQDAGSTTFGYNDIAYEPSQYTKTYYTGYGEYGIYATMPVPETEENKQLSYVLRSGTTCFGSYNPIVAAVNNISQNGSTLSIFPNPANNELTIKTTGILPYTISIHNIIGQEVSTLHTTQQQQIINTENLPAGLYNRTVTDEIGYRQTEKVSIVH